MARIAKPLTLEWIESMVSQPLFRAAMRQAGGRDPYRLGWEPLDPVQEIALDLRIGDIPWASAEGAVGLASIAEAVRHRLKTRFVGPPARNSWGKALRLEQLTTDKWDDPGAMSNTGLVRLSVDPLRKWTLETSETCEKVADILRDRTTSLLAPLSYREESGVVAAVHLLVYQALLNVFQHAYGTDISKIAFSAITVCPAKQWLGPRSPLTPAEQSWLASSSERFLEVAIADCGAGVPATLWESYRDRYRKDFDELEPKTRQLGTTASQSARAMLQQKITHWSLAHDSTRKREADFPDKRSYLNWRGLHRATNIIADVSGCIVIRSGQARAGYVFPQSSGCALTTNEQYPRKEFPGTTVLIRIPIPAPTPRHVRLLGTEPSQTLNLCADQVVQAAEAGAKLTDTPGGTPFVAAICHPFVTLKAEECGGILDLIGSIPPNCIQLHAFAQVAADPVLTQFHAFKDDYDCRLPRVICFWSRGERGTWKFAGLMPRQAQPFIIAVERGDTVPIPSELRDFAKELHRAYAPFVVIEEGALRLDAVKQDIDKQTVEDALQLSFNAFVSLPGEQPWLTDEPETFIRLRNGKLVKKYINVLELLHASDMLARAVGRKLSHRIQVFQNEKHDVRVITDSEASYFLARHLLSEQSVRVDLRPHEDAAQFQGPTVLFSDAVYRGKTMEMVASHQNELIGAICGVDLRRAASNDRHGPTIYSLVKLPFDPIETTEEKAKNAKSILEVDQVTLDPCTPADPKQYALGTSDERTIFIQERPDLFRTGIHLSGGRVHVVSPSTGQMIHRHAAALIRWIVTEIVKAAETHQPNYKNADIVLFTRADAYVRDLVPKIADQLESQQGSKVFGSTVAAAPYKSRQVFARISSEQDLLADVQRLGKHGVLAFERPNHFVAILLDDAAVTGRGLLNFLMSLAGLHDEQRPINVIAVPVFTRLTPIEDYLYTALLKTLGPPSDNATTPFTFAPLFRLRIRSYDDPAATSAFKHLTSIARNEGNLGPRLSAYVMKIRQRLEDAVHESAGEGRRSIVCSHPFYSGSEVREDMEVSTRAISIRHLIALYEQNVAVLGDLLHEIRIACGAGDASLLTLFASEPSLLDLRPLKRCCHDDLTALALMTVKSSGLQAPVKSDALIVLLGNTLPSADILSEIAVAIESNEDLLDQFLVMLLANGHPDPVSLNNIGAICKRVTSSEASMLIKTSLKAWDDVHRPYSISNLDEAATAVARSVAITIYHASGDREFNAPTTMWIQMAPASLRALQPASEVIPIFRSAITFARDYLVPALEGVEYIARQQQDGPAAHAIRAAHNRLIYLLTELDQHLSLLGDEPLGEKQTTEIESLWTQIKECTQFGPPQTYLATPQPKGEAGILESWMSDFFCLPAEIAAELRKVWAQLTISADWQQPTISGLGGILLRAPLTDVREIFELLFEDARKHGTGKIRVEFVRPKEQDPGLKALVSNTISGARVRGGGKSQQRVNDIVSRNHWEVNFPQTAIYGELYSVRIVFPIVYELWEG
ncbi:MAG TPA: hypothetical protein VG488_11555 [Candidatus Angelobacter sp.]|jgi:hypothetical protein|nr:hypothetical protein [Candidatus Angelobacter sp.]